VNRSSIVLALGLAAALAGCTSSQVGVPPTVTVVDPIATNKLEFAVGTANIGGVATGLNTVVSYRQPNGLDGTLLNTPTITGPAGFVNNGSTGFDAGTNTIAGSPQPQVGVAALVSTFGSTGGAFAYGFQPDNSTTAGSPSFARYSLPFFAPAAFGTTFPYIGGPPAYPNVRDSTFPSGFQGYTMGFTSFALTPVAGTYSLTLNVPTGFSGSTPTSANVTAAANLTSLAILPTFATPVLTPARNGAGALTGGATVTATVPAGVTQAMIIVRNGTGSCYPGSNAAPAYFTFLTNTTGAQTFTLPDHAGPTFGAQTSTMTLCPGDTYRVYAVGFNYDAFGAGPPGNRSQTPTITGSNGQADITQSKPSATLTFPAS
jgi:hypothetical protein